MILKESSINWLILHSRATLIRPTWWLNSLLHTWHPVPVSCPILIFFIAPPVLPTFPPHLHTSIDWGQKWSRLNKIQNNFTEHAMTNPIRSQIELCTLYNPSASSPIAWLQIKRPVWSACLWLCVHFGEFTIRPVAFSIWNIAVIPITSLMAPLHSQPLHSTTLVWCPLPVKRMPDSLSIVCRMYSSYKLHEKSPIVKWLAVTPLPLMDCMHIQCIQCV